MRCEKKCRISYYDLEYDDKGGEGEKSSCRDEAEEGFVPHAPFLDVYGSAASVNGEAENEKWSDGD